MMGDVHDGPVVVRCNVVCNEDPVFNVYADIHILTSCKYCSKLKMNHASNYVNCYQSIHYSTGVNRYRNILEKNFSLSHC